MSQKEFDVLVVGELNVDLILNGIDGFPEMGKEKLADDLTLTLGSSSAIFASNLSSLGANVGFIGKIGDDLFGHKVLAELQKKNVSTDLIIKDKSLATGVTVALNYDEDRAMVTHQGAMTELGIDDITDEQLAKARHLHFSSYFLQPKIAKDISTLMKRAKALGLTTSIDPQWDPEEKWDMNLDQVLPHVDVFLPNQAELVNLTGDKDWEVSIRKLQQKGNHVIVKLGSKGSAYMHEGEIRQEPSFYNDEVVDAIGAGDSFNTGFIRKFIDGASIKECCRFGNLTGALSTTNSGGTNAFTDLKALESIAKEKFDLEINLTSL
ncbi:carbohydrate kinase family protein [Gracilimonas mengyeensis]|uniref:Sugar or nucleoside kinase, ribokinase family n=1 Tax=Gracilimonas mengyeensis TaxID=1302730 RepID=A0A521BUW9_9BACT|nr:carbohydrate kinase family protein [Gracilimonas mengyeensis]SMO50461.1 Sugar or nucleoside kinase, ribokinase family [Gracilimonas mengyeensis]